MRRELRDSDAMTVVKALDRFKKLDQSAQTEDRRSIHGAFQHNVQVHQGSNGTPHRTRKLHTLKTPLKATM